MMKYNDDCTLEILIPDVKGWAIVRFHEGRGACDDIIYGEHVTGCKEEFNGMDSHWCWEWHDADPTEEERDTCWVCRKTVPEEIVALVAMMNWKELAG